MLQLKKVEILRNFLIQSLNFIEYEKELALVVKMIPHLPSLNENKKINCDFGQKLSVTNEALLRNAWAEHSSRNL